MTATQVLMRFFKDEGLGWLGITALKEASKDFNEGVPSGGIYSTYCKSFPEVEKNKIVVDILLKFYGTTLEYAISYVAYHSDTLRKYLNANVEIKNKYRTFLKGRVKKNYRKRFLSDTYGEFCKCGKSKYRSGHHKIDFTLTNNDTCI